MKKGKVGKRRIRIIDNSVYCEILYRLGNYKRSLKEFVEHFIDDDLLDNQKLEPHKKESVLFRQMEILVAKDFLISKDHFEPEDKEIYQNYEEGKLKNKRKVYFINFKKIIEEFINYVIEKKQNYPRDESKELKENIEELKDKKFREEAARNPFINYLFKNSVEEIRRCNFNHRDLTLAMLFDSIINSGYVEDALKHDILEEYEEMEGKEIMLKDLKYQTEYVDKKLKQHYGFFLDFLDKVGINAGIKSIVESMFRIIAKKAVRGFDDGKDSQLNDINFFKLEI